MSTFSVSPQAGPRIEQPPGAQSTAQVGAKERAIAALMADSKHSLPVKEASNVSPEEAVGLRQNISNEAPQAEPVAPLAEPNAPAAAPAEKPLSSEYAILARQAKAMRAKQVDLKSREDALRSREAALNAPKAPVFDESRYVSKDKLNQDLFGTLSELGLSYDQITQQAVNAPTPEQIASEQRYKALEAKLAKLESEQEGTKKSWEQQQQDSYKQAVNQIRAETQALVKHNPAFETIKETNSVDDVVELIERTFKEDGLLMTVEEASQQVEDYLMEEALKLVKIKKIQQRLQPAPQAGSQKPTSQPNQPGMKTLTNQVSSTRQLSARERALLAFEGKKQ